MLVAIWLWQCVREADKLRRAFSKPVPIPGTGITLDTPEAVDAWIAERKKRYPTSQRVTDRVGRSTVGTA